MSFLLYNLFMYFFWNGFIGGFECTYMAKLGLNRNRKFLLCKAFLKCNWWFICILQNYWLSLFPELDELNYNFRKNKPLILFFPNVCSQTWNPNEGEIFFQFLQLMHFLTCPYFIIFFTHFILSSHCLQFPNKYLDSKLLQPLLSF